VNFRKIPNFKVIYTRTTDVFIELANRPKIANKANANLFVSIHCNSVKSFQPYETLSWDYPSDLNP
jgi:N-acetylmuramoyl-L-alanine amidase